LVLCFQLNVYKYILGVGAVLELTEMLREKAMPAAVKELEELTAFAKEQGFVGELELWDIPFWSERLRENQYEFEEEELKAYFPFPSVLNGLFSLANRLFGVTIEAADGEAQVWHKDVRFFKVKDDKTGEYIASFFLDPYSRPAEKRGGAWVDICLNKSKVLNRKPVAYIICNGSPPAAEADPSLMTFREVETLFHEFGHALQVMLTTVEHGDAAGSMFPFYLMSLRLCNFLLSYFLQLTILSGMQLNYPPNLWRIGAMINPPYTHSPSITKLKSLFLTYSSRK
jgi:oligopeptidase A